MRRARFIAFLPPIALLIMAMVAGAVNSVGQRPDSLLPAPVVRAVAKTDDPATARLSKELKVTLQRYCKLHGAAQERATYSVGRIHSDRAFLNKRLAILRAWPDFRVIDIEKRRSGLVVALLQYDGEFLKAWMILTPEGWKLAGLLKPTRP